LKLRQVNLCFAVFRKSLIRVPIFLEQIALLNEIENMKVLTFRIFGANRAQREKTDNRNSGKEIEITWKLSSG